MQFYLTKCDASAKYIEDFSFFLFASSHCCPGWAIALHKFPYLTIFLTTASKIIEQHIEPQT